MLSTTSRRITIVAATLVVACLIAVTVAVSAHGSSLRQRRQIGATTLSSFKVVLIVVRGGPGHRAEGTLRANGYERTGGHWKLIASKRIGRRDEWDWFSVATCSLTVSEYRNNVEPSPPVVRYDSMRASLLFTPATGCTGIFSERWRPLK